MNREEGGIENFLNRRPEMRWRLGLASLFVILVTGPFTFALFMIFIAEGFGSRWEFLFLELSFTSLLLAILALGWAVFTPAWLEPILEKVSAKVATTGLVLYLGVLILLLFWK